MNVLGVFSGIGGIELGLQAAGMTIVGHVELDEWCRNVLHRHWPDVPQHDDVTTTPTWWAEQERPVVDLVAGGFPCQPFSTSGKQLGTADERWMWPAMAEVVRAVRPSYVVVENVAALVRDRAAFGRVLGDLHELGFNAEWATLRASDFGAPHRRERVYIVAYTSRDDGRDQDEPTTTRAIELEPRGSGRQHGGGHWVSEPALDRVAHGIPRRVVYPPLHALGNAVVPPILEHVGRAVMRHAQEVAA